MFNFEIEGLRLEFIEGTSAEGAWYYFDDATIRLVYTYNNTTLFEKCINFNSKAKTIFYNIVNGYLFLQYMDNFNEFDALRFSTEYLCNHDLDCTFHGRSVFEQAYIDYLKLTEVKDED